MKSFSQFFYAMSLSRTSRTTKKEGSSSPYEVDPRDFALQSAQAQFLVDSTSAIAGADIFAFQGLGKTSLCVHNNPSVAIFVALKLALALIVDAIDGPMNKADDES